MKRSIAVLKAGCKALRFIIEDIVPEGPDRDEAVALVRSAFYTGRDAIRAEGAEVDRLVVEHYEAENKALGERLVFDFDVPVSSPVVRGTWVTVAHVMGQYGEGHTWADILRSHPELTADDLTACLTYHNFENEHCAAA